MTELARKDLFVCLGIWLALEIVCFAILPALQLALPRTSLQNWFLISLLLGTGGAALLAYSTQLTDFLQSHGASRHSYFFQSILIALVSWLGLFGIGFPLFVISMQIFGKLFGLLKT